jgi:hypothetical protein
MPTNIDLFYLDKSASEDWTNLWKYYRVTTIGQVSIEVCEVEFPSWNDKGIPIQHPWVIGIASAHDIKGEHLRTLGIDQEQAILIGMVVREV